MPYAQKNLHLILFVLLIKITVISLPWWRLHFAVYWILLIFHTSMGLNSKYLPYILAIVLRINMKCFTLHLVQINNRVFSKIHCGTTVSDAVHRQRSNIKIVDSTKKFWFCHKQRKLLTKFCHSDHATASCTNQHLPTQGESKHSYLSSFLVTSIRQTFATINCWTIRRKVFNDVADCFHCHIFLVSFKWDFFLLCIVIIHALNNTCASSIGKRANYYQCTYYYPSIHSVNFYGNHV